MTPFLNAAVAHRPEVDLGTDARFGSTRTFLEPGLVVRTDPRLSLSFSVGLGREDYRFMGGPTGLGAAEPWEKVSTLQLNLGAVWLPGRRWILFGGPTLRWAAEEDAQFDEASFGGLAVGGGYVVSDRLTIGPGLGIFQQLDASPRSFPFLVIRWKLARDLTLKTGRGVGASQGPGLSLSWAPAEKWELALGGRYELERFRLDDEGVAPGGVGQRSAYSVSLSLAREFGGRGRFAVFGGADLAGQLRLDSAGGDELAAADYDPSPFVGFVLEL